MVSAKFFIAGVFAMTALLSACNTNPQQKLTREERILREEQKALPTAIVLTAADYNVTAECADAAKTDKLKNLHWIVKIKSDGHYLESQQNFDANCEDACALVDGGTYVANELQVIFTVTQKFSNDKNQFESVKPSPEKTYYLMANNSIEGKVILIDPTDKNLCQGKMILTLKR